MDKEIARRMKDLQKQTEVRVGYIHPNPQAPQTHACLRTDSPTGQGRSGGQGTVGVVRVDSYLTIQTLWILCMNKPDQSNGGSMCTWFRHTHQNYPSHTQKHKHHHASTHADISLYALTMITSATLTLKYSCMCICPCIFNRMGPVTLHPAGEDGQGNCAHARSSAERGRGSWWVCLSAVMRPEVR